jgi:hypothetical protein
LNLQRLRLRKQGIIAGGDRLVTVEQVGENTAVKKRALLDLTMKRFLETLILRSEFSEIIAPFSNPKKRCW